MFLIAYIFKKIIEVLNLNFFKIVNSYHNPKFTDDEIENIKNKAKKYFSLIETNRNKINAYFTKLQTNNAELPDTLDKSARNIIYENIKDSLKNSDSSEIVQILILKI